MACLCEKNSERGELVKLCHINAAVRFFRHGVCVYGQVTKRSNKVIYRYFISVLYIIAFQFFSDKLCNVVIFHLSIFIAGVLIQIVTLRCYL